MNAFKWQRLAGLAALLLSAPRDATGGGFFDDVPAKGYIRDDVSLEVLSVGDRDGSAVATVRYLRLVLDPGRRDVAPDLWPQREMLFVERVTGERLVFERLTGIPRSADPDALQPRGRIGLESGGVLETFTRGGPGASQAPGSCAALDGLIRFGSVDIPVGRDDLAVQTVRLGIAQLLEGTLSSREIDLISDTVPILLRAESQGLPLGPLTILEILFPGRLFAKSTAAITFRVSSATPLNPASSPWPSITQAPEMLPGVPAY